MREPTVINAGFSYTWTKSLSDYPASASWALSYSLVNSVNQYEIASTASGDDHVVSIIKTASAEYAVGSYRLVGYVDDGTDRVQVYSGDVVVQPDLTKVADLRSYAESTLDSIEAMIAKSASRDQQSVMVDGQTLVRRTFTELIVMRDRFKREVAAERRAAEVAAGIGGNGRVQLRFK